jgi:hypothetical protein
VCCVAPCRVALCCVVLRHVVMRRIVLRRVVLRHVVMRRVMLRRVVLRYVVLNIDCSGHFSCHYMQCVDTPFAGSWRDSGPGNGWGDVAGAVNYSRRQGTSDRYIGCYLRKRG